MVRPWFLSKVIAPAAVFSGSLRMLRFHLLPNPTLLILGSFPSACCICSVFLLQFFSAVSPLLAQLCRQRWEEKESEVTDSRSSMEGRTSSILLLPKGCGCGKAACYNGSA